MNTPTLTSTVLVPEFVLFRRLEDESVLLHLSRGIYFGLDPVGTRIFELIIQRGTLLEVLERIVGEYDVPRERAEADLLKLIQELSDRGLVVVATAPVSGRSARETSNRVTGT